MSAAAVGAPPQDTCSAETAPCVRADWVGRSDHFSGGSRGTQAVVCLLEKLIGFAHGDRRRLATRVEPTTCGLA
jgi:hypothetical protein